MRNIKRTVVVGMLMIVLLATTVTGCGSNGNINPTSKPTETTQTENASSTPSEKVKIEYWHVFSENMGGPSVRELVEKFNQQHKDIEVVEKFQPNMYLGLMQNLQAALAAGNPPAVATIGYQFLQYTNDNLPYVPIDEIAKQDPEGQAFLDAFPPNISDLGKVDGKLIGMPYSVSVPVLYYNADMFKEVGLSPENPPKTWEEVREFAKLIKNKTGNYGLYVQEPADNWAQQALMESNGARILSKDSNRKIKATFDSPEAIGAYQLLADMVLKDKTALHATWEEGIQAFISGKVGMLITTIARRSYIESSAKFKVLTAPFPVFDSKPRRVPAGGNALFIFAKKPEEQKAAWEFIKFLNSPEGLTIWVKGTGYLPHRKNITDDPRYLKTFMEENPLMKAAVDQLPDIVPWVSFPGSNALEAEKALLDARDAILTGRKTPAEALKEAAAKINKLIKQ